MRRQAQSWVRTVAAAMPIVVIFAGSKWGSGGCDDVERDTAAAATTTAR